MLIPINDRIHRMVLPISPGWDVNVYLVEGDKGYTVIDTGIHSEQTIQRWEQLLASGIRLEKVVVTHAHSDHIGMAGWLKRKCAIPVIMSERSYDVMTKGGKSRSNGDARPFAEHDGPEFPRQMRTAFSYDRVEPDACFADGQVIRLGNDTFKAIWTPGHAADHYCFYNDEHGILFVGDHVMTAVSPVITTNGNVDKNPLADYFRSLDRLEAEVGRIACALPGHGPAIGDLGSRMEEIRQGHRFRMNQLLEHVGDGRRTAGELSRLLYPGDESDAKSFMAFQTTLARLIYLKHAGELDTVNVDGKVYFYLNRPKT